jgi:hypothetical protein
MTWKERLAALVLAGGALALVGCGDDTTEANPGSTDMAYAFICNANPDPCCLHPDMKGCGPSDGGTHD